MAVRFDASGDSLTRTTSLPVYTALTIMAWVYMSVDRDTFTAFFVGDNGAGGGYWVLTEADGTTLRLEASGTFGSGTSITAATWTHLAVTSNGTNAILYKNGVQDISLGSGTPTLVTLYVGNSGAVDWFNGRIAAVKIYDAALLAADILQEMQQVLPVRTANLNSFYPLLSVADDQVDYSGAGLTLTVNGTLATEDGPPIPWKAGRKRVIYVPAAGAPVVSTDWLPPPGISRDRTLGHITY